ncbi:hypothetical protein ACHAWC_010572 [Mediolabrus comicus]
MIMLRRNVPPYCYACCGQYGRRGNEANNLDASLLVGGCGGGSVKGSGGIFFSLLIRYVFGFSFSTPIGDDDLGFNTYDEIGRCVMMSICIIISSSSSFVASASSTS